MNAQTLQIRVEAVNHRMRFEAQADEHPVIVLDYTPPYGDDGGYTPLELILISLATCLASTVRVVLDSRLNLKVRALRAEADGLRRERHPTSFERITLRLFVAADLTAERLQAVVQESCERICPVFDLLKGNTEIRIETIKVEE